MSGAAATIGAPASTRTGAHATSRAGAAAKPYTNPYVAGVGLGLVLLLAFVIMGRGLGASGAFSSVVSAGVQAATPAHAAGNDFYARYLGQDGRSPLADWLVFEIIGVTMGGFLSALAARRFRFTTDRGPRITNRARLMLAFGGGSIMGYGARLARGCTSGQALTGGALLSVGSWLFIACAFAAAYAAAPLFRKAWT